MLTILAIAFIVVMAIGYGQVFQSLTPIVLAGLLIWLIL